jgi:2-C-methyl-D-erythritol 2,4-cyclodiphosphate synthase
MRIGFGNDIHKLEEGIPLVIGGVEIPSDQGAVGHSDADVLFHAITDAILGAMALGDIGSHFPSTDDRWKGADSEVFLSEAVRLMRSEAMSVANVDSIITLETPKLRPYIEEIRKSIASVLMTDLKNVSVKAKTAEGLDAVGERRAIKAEACILLVG